MGKKKIIKIIAVDENNKFLKFVNKDIAHQVKGILHRAFSIFIFNSCGELLLQQRSKYKKLWPLYWSNTCCSHPKANAKDAKRENTENVKKNLTKQAEKRLKEEMGFTCKLKPLFKFYYKAVYKKTGSENELCTVFLGRYQGQRIVPDEKEAADYRWLSLDRLNKKINENPGIYTPWLKKMIKDKKINSAILKFND